MHLDGIRVMLEVCTVTGVDIQSTRTHGRGCGAAASSGRVEEECIGRGASRDIDEH